MSKDKEKLYDKGAVMPIKKSLKDSVNDFFFKALEKGVFDAVLIPMMVPSNDSFAYVLVKDKSLLKDGFFLPPTMSFQGAKAVSNVTRLGKGNMKIAAILRPCEIRGTVELTKLEQTNLENVTLFSMDCSGVMPTSDFIKHPDKAMKEYDEAVKNLDDKKMRPVCQICDKNSITDNDIHIGTFGAKKDSFYLIANSEKGKETLKELGIASKDNIEIWRAKVKEQIKNKNKKRADKHKSFKTEIRGLDGLTNALSQCINCHNCMRVCPICSCRLCFFDSDLVKHPSDDYLAQSESKGSIRFLPDTMLFHMGRMMHMSLSCVSCGLCEDSCPVGIPVAQIFSMVADETQSLFNYEAGRSKDEPLPMKTFEKDELHDVEDA